MYRTYAQRCIAPVVSSPRAIFQKTSIPVGLPLIAPSVLTAALLVFVDVMKELPATLMLRPFNFDTLAIKANQYASDERLSWAAAPSLAIVAVGIIPCIVLIRSIAAAARRGGEPPSLP